jgi:hypothetical protein
MDAETLIDNYPRLYHMAAAGSWPAIKQHGLLTTEEIVSTSALSDQDKQRLLEERRPQTEAIAHPTIGLVSVRDQKPLTLAHLQNSLTDLTVTEWLRVLNGRVFFWLHPNKLERLLSARAYRSAEQVVLTVATKELLSAHLADVRLSAMNSGATLWPSTPARGSNTFQAVEEYDWATHRKKGLERAIVELAVVGGVPDIARFVERVERRKQGDVVEVLWSR